MCCRACCDASALIKKRTVIQAIRLIEAALCASDGLRVTNPATGEAVATVRAWTQDEVAEAIVHADAVRRDWAAQTAQHRANVLLK